MAFRSIQADLTRHRWQLEQLLGDFDSNARHVAAVRILSMPTGTFPAVDSTQPLASALQREATDYPEVTYLRDGRTGYAGNQALRGSQLLLRAFQALNDTTEEQNVRIDAAVRVFNGLEEDYNTLGNRVNAPAPEGTRVAFALAKARELEPEGGAQLQEGGVHVPTRAPVYIPTGCRSHFNITKIVPTNTGYRATLYDTGGESDTVRIGPDGREQIHVVLERDIRPVVPILHFIHANTWKMDLDRTSDDYHDTAAKIAAMYERTLPVRSILGNRQGAPNTCTVRAQREVIRDVLQDEALSNAFNEFVTGIDAMGTSDIRAALGQSVEQLRVREQEERSFAESHTRFESLHNAQQSREERGLWNRCRELAGRLRGAGLQDEETFSAGGRSDRGSRSR